MGKERTFGIKKLSFALITFKTVSLGGGINTGPMRKGRKCLKKRRSGISEGSSLVLAWLLAAIRWCLFSNNEARIFTGCAHDNTSLPHELPHELLPYCLSCTLKLPQIIKMHHYKILTCKSKTTGSHLLYLCGKAMR